MPTEFKPAPLEVRKLLDDVISRHDHFEPLFRAGIAVDLLLAFADEGKFPLKLHGGTAIATVEATSPKERVSSPFDVRITLDAVRFFARNPDAQRAVLAHELFHVVLTETGGGFARDLYGRLKVRMRPDDYVINGFATVYSWYGEDSAEARSLEAVRQTLRQQPLPGS